jgi:catechol 2,3-dioxygenase-like lactoylglutathione lyase family enzyme
MEIRQFRVVVRAKNFERTSRFYGESLAFPRLQSWDREDERGALFQAGAAVVQVVGRPASAETPRSYDETYDYQGPHHKMTIALLVPSAETAYQEAHFRDKNIPGGLRRDTDGGLIFETHDPDGIKIVFKQAEG